MPTEWITYTVIFTGAKTSDLSNLLHKDGIQYFIRQVDARTYQLQVKESSTILVDGILNMLQRKRRITYWDRIQ